jgi:hypothetical protein
MRPAPPPASEQGSKQKEKPELPVGVSFEGGFGLGELEFGEVLKGFRLLEIGLAGIGEVGGPVEQECVALFDLEEAGLVGGTEEMSLGGGDGDRSGRRACRELKRGGFFTLQMGDREALAEVEVRGLGGDLFLTDRLEIAVEENGERGELASVAAEEIEVAEELLGSDSGAAQADERAIRLPEQHAVAIVTRDDHALADE